MNKLSSKINTKDFINTFNHIFLNLNKIFMEFKTKQKDIEVFYKDKNEKYTNFDWTIQKIIENYLNKYFKDYKFVGEENTSFEAVKKDFSPYLTSIDEITFSPIKDDDVVKENKEYNAEDFCIYCDPIDATSSFIKGAYENVTVLVGVSYKKNPIIGIIHFFSYENKQPATFFNLPGTGVFKLTVDNDTALLCDSKDYGSLKYSMEKIVSHNNEKMNFVITASRENPTMTKSKYSI